MKAHRRYSDVERSTALALLAANGGNVMATARTVGIPQKTLHNWAKATRRASTDSTSCPFGIHPLEEIARRFLGLAEEAVRLLGGQAIALNVATASGPAFTVGTASTPGMPNTAHSLAIPPTFRPSTGEGG